MISWLSHQDSGQASAEHPPTRHLDDDTKEDDVNAKLIEFLRQPRPICFHSVICIVNDDLPSPIEEPLDGVFTRICNLLPKRDRLLALCP